MPIRPLPENPSLEQLKKQAKWLHKAARAGDAVALAWVREFHPRAAQALADFALSEGQLVTARAHGFESWARLKDHVEGIEAFRFVPPTGSDTEADGAPADTLVRLACVNYGDWHPSLAERARRLLAAHPALAQASLAAAATVGDVSAVRAFLARDPAAASARTGPFHWEPVLYACYSRLDSADPAHSTLEVARLLLAAGADPNAGFLWRGHLPPFTALTGAFGDGENGKNQPPHAHRDELARMLLDAGADPNDGQTLYNRHFGAADDHLRLLFAYGLGTDKRGPWYARFGERLHSPSRLLVEELWAAARKNLAARATILVEHGADVNTPGRRDGKTPYEAALLAGNLEIAAYLAAHGARPVELDPVRAFAAACVAGRRAEALALLERDPGLFAALGRAGRIDLLHQAVEARRPEGLRLMAELGFELSGLGRNTALHDAAWAGDLELVVLLVELGADPTVREPAFHATPLGWADHNQQPHVVGYLLPFADVFDAVRFGAVERLAALLAADPTLVRAVDPQGRPLAESLRDDTSRRDEVVALLRTFGADLP